MSFHIIFICTNTEHIWSELWHSFRSMHSLLMQQTVYANEAWVEKQHFNEIMIIILLSIKFSILKNKHTICECMRFEQRRQFQCSFIYEPCFDEINLKKTNFLLKCKVIFQRNESVKGHVVSKWFLSFFHNWNEIFFSIEYEWNSWNISLKLAPTEYTQEDEEFNANDAKLHNSIYRNRCQLPITGVE